MSTINMSAQEALAKLKEGNKRFAESNPTKLNQNIDKVKELANGQKPFAVVLTCSDSRLSPEIIFDQGLGDLFVVRVAGNLIDEVVLGSIEYAVEHLGSNLILVLGHTKCGAVAAACSEGEFPKNISSLVEKIKPAVENAKSMSGDNVQNAVVCNVQNVVKDMKSQSYIISELIENRGLEVVGAYYELESGEVKYL